MTKINIRASFLIITIKKIISKIISIIKRIIFIILDEKFKEAMELSTNTDFIRR